MATTLSSMQASIVPRLRRGTRRGEEPRMHQPAEAYGNGPPVVAVDGQGNGQGNDQWEAPSWEEIVTQHSARVYRLSYRLTGNLHDAEDLTQEVFVRVFRSLSSYTPGTFEGWLHRITTNLFLDQARRKSKIRFDALADDAETRMPSKWPAPDVLFADRLFDDDVESALADLPPDFRAAVVLCDIEGLSYEEIAEVLGLKLGTVRSRIHRGRSMLRKSLAHRAPGSGRKRYSGPAEPVPAAQTGRVT